MIDQLAKPTATGGLALAVLGALFVVGAALGYRAGVFELGSSFSVLRWGAYIGVASVAVSFVGGALGVWRRRPIGVLAMAGVGLVVGGAVYGVPARQQAIARSVPPIHDITTDTTNPPEFVAVLPLRANAPNSVEYDPTVAPQQLDAYPDVQPIMLDDPPHLAFARAQAAVAALGWQVVAEDAAAGRNRGDGHDLLVRLQGRCGGPSSPRKGNGSRIDIRSVSRVGRSDVGANAARIHAYTQRLGDR